jgi:hypothetical protein
MRRNITTPERLAEWHAMLTYEAQQRGYKPGWATVSFKDKFGAGGGG